MHTLPRERRDRKASRPLAPTRLPRRQIALAALVGCLLGPIGCTAEVDLQPRLTTGAPGAEVIIDELGIAHVYASSDEALFRAAGYQMAVDRLFQMDLTRRRALGRQAEVLGARHLDQDRISRVFDFARWGAADRELLAERHPDVHALIDAWTAGVNLRIAEVRDGAAPLPYGFGPEQLGYLPEPWQPADTHAVAKMLYFGSGNSLEHELAATLLARYFPEAFNALELSRPMFPVATIPDVAPAGLAKSPGQRPRFRGAAASASESLVLEARLRRLQQALEHVPRTASNNWAVAGSLTDSGRPLIAGDPHQPLTSPSLMYAQHLNSADAGGRYDVIGFSFVGVPGISLGHNRRIQWTATNNYADVLDLWEVAVEDGGKSARVGADSVPISERIEQIAVTGQQPVELVVRELPGHGVLLPEDLLPLQQAPETALLVRWTGFAATDDSAGFFRMATAQDIPAWEAAVDLMDVAIFNFLAADARDVSYRVHARIPDRGDPRTRQMPYTVLPGSDPGSLWRSDLPDERLPRARNPTRGWLATANNDPWGFTFDGDVGNDPFYYGFFYAPGNRARRLHDELTRLAARGAIGRGDMQALQTDTHSPLADVLIPRLAGLQRLHSTSTGDDDAALLIDQLTTWDRRMDLDSPAAVVFHVWLHYLAQAVVGDELGFTFPLLMGQAAPFMLKLPVLAITGSYPRSGDILDADPERLMRRALDRTARFLREQFGGLEPGRYRWADVHTTRFASPYGGALDGGAVATAGGVDTVNVSVARFFAEDGSALSRWSAVSGPIFRTVTSFAADGTPQAWANFPRGNSGDPDSPHWADRLPDWVSGTYRRLPFSRPEIEAAAPSAAP
jgi:penicillin amidase